MQLASLEASASVICSAIDVGFADLSQRRDCWWHPSRAILRCLATTNSVLFL